MTATNLATPMDSDRLQPQPRWTALLPREHGSWALVGEPLVVALLAAPSWRGATFALAALALFLARRPALMITTGSDRAHAGRALAVLAGAGLVLAGLAVGADFGRVAPALIVALVAAGIFAWFDRQREARAVLAECAGAAAFAGLAATIVLLADNARGPDVALGVAGFALMRACTSILPVRVYVRRRKGRAASAGPALAAAGIACVLACVAAPRLGTWVPAVWAAVFLARTAWLTGPWAPTWPARRIGWLEATLGLLASATTGVSLR